MSQKIRNEWLPYPILVPRKRLRVRANENQKGHLQFIVIQRHFFFLLFVFIKIRCILIRYRQNVWVISIFVIVPLSVVNTRIVYIQWINSNRIYAANVRVKTLRTPLPFCIAACPAVTHPRMVSVDKKLRLCPGRSGRDAWRHESVQHRLLVSASSTAPAIVQFVTTASLGEHADRLGSRRALPEHRIASGMRSTCWRDKPKNETFRFYVVFVMST